MYGLKEPVCLPIKHHGHGGDTCKTADSQFYYNNYTHGKVVEPDEVRRMEYVQQYIE